MSNVAKPATNTPNAGYSSPYDRIGQTPLSLGAVFFNTSECPEDFPVGALKQMNVTHTLPGGTRVVNTFGPSADPVRWRGRLWSSNVDVRIQQLRLYAKSAQKVLLSWHSEQYNVIIVDFIPHYHHKWYAEYEIEVVVVQDQNGALTIASGVSIDQQVAGLQTMMLTQNNLIFQIDPVGAAVFQDKINKVTTAVATAGPIATATAANKTSVLTTIDSASTQVNSYAATLPAGASQAPASLQLAASLTTMAATINRGQQPKAVLAQGTSLFEIAAQHYGDPSLAYELSAANNLLSPWLTSAQQTTVLLPSLVSQKLTSPGTVTR